MNRVVLIGRLTRDPEMRTTPTGRSVATFTLAVDRRFSANRQAGADGQPQQREADFIPIVTWDKLADLCSRYTAKGRQVAVAGRIQVRNYTDNSNQRRYVTEIVADEVQFLSPREGNASAGGYPSAPPSQEFAPPEDDAPGFSNYEMSDDELPF